MRKISSNNTIIRQRSSPNTNGSVFGVPRLPPKQATHQSPSWDSILATSLTTPRWMTPVPSASISIPQQATSVSASQPPPPPIRFSSPAPSSIAPSTITIDAQSKEEMLEKLHSYHTQIQALNTLVAQLLTSQQQQQQQQLLEQQNSLSSSIRECTKRDVAVQSEPPSPCMSDDVGESASMVKSNRTSPSSPKIDPMQHYQSQLQQQQTPIIAATTRVCFLLIDENHLIDGLLLFIWFSYSSAQFQSSMPNSTPTSNMHHPNEPVIDYVSLRKSADTDRYLNENTPVASHYPPIWSLSPPPQPAVPLAAPPSLLPQSAPADRIGS